jgi:hypothetical protein
VVVLAKHQHVIFPPALREFGKRVAKRWKRGSDGTSVEEIGDGSEM